MNYRSRLNRSLLLLVVLALSWTLAVAQPDPAPTSPPIFVPDTEPFSQPETALGIAGTDIQALGESDKESDRPIFRPRPGPYQPRWNVPTRGEDIRPPDEEPQTPINPEAPREFQAMVMAYQQDDMEMAAKYADQYVRYMVNLTFDLRQLSQLIGEAMVRQGLIAEDSWVGGEQFLNKQLAAARKKAGETAFAPTHEMVLKRIVPDPEKLAEIYFFCSPTVRYCRQMGPDIERLWRVVQEDNRLRMGVFIIGETQEDWLKAFKEYTGMTMPLQPGADSAKTLRIAFVPALVVRSPTTNTVYSRTGLITFDHMYEFVRTVQGLPLDPTRVVEQLRSTAIGEVETARRDKRPVNWEKGLIPPPHSAKQSPKPSPKKKPGTMKP